MQKEGRPNSSTEVERRLDKGTLPETPHDTEQSQRPPSAGTKLMLSVAERAQQAGKGMLPVFGLH